MPIGAGITGTSFIAAVRSKARAQIMTAEAAMTPAAKPPPGL